MDFTSDNVTGAHPDIIAAIAAANDGTCAPYGADVHTLRAEAMLRDVFGCDCAIFLLTSGTAANALALAAMAEPWQAVFCHDDAHVHREECGAPEFFSGGAKLLGIDGDTGKITLAALRDMIERHPRGVVRKSPPSALTLSQATECGTVYTPDELAELSACAHEAGLRVHMDGARFANALAFLGCSAADMTWRAGIDCLSFGATKNGALACEALIFFDKTLAEDFAHKRKRGGQTLAKGRFLGAQMTAYLEDDRWLGWARAANGAAVLLADGLRACPGVRIVWPVEANEVFAILPRNVHAALQAGGVHYGVRGDQAARDAVGCGDEEVFVRLVTSFSTPEDDVRRLCAIASEA